MSDFGSEEILNADIFEEKTSSAHRKLITFLFFVYCDVTVPMHPYPDYITRKLTKLDLKNLTSEEREIFGTTRLGYQKRNGSLFFHSTRRNSTNS